MSKTYYFLIIIVKNSNTFRNKNKIQNQRVRKNLQMKK